MTQLEKIKYINVDFAKQPLYLMANEIPENAEDIADYFQKVANEQEKYIRRFIGKGYEIEELTKALSAAWVSGIEEECRKRLKDERKG